MKDTIIVNLFAGPGAGKTSMMSGIFSELKWLGVDCELAPEYAKTLVWKGDMETLSDQEKVSETQYGIQLAPYGQVDVIITDSPLILGVFYGKDTPVDVKHKIINRFFEFHNRIDIFVNRVKKYNPNGRLQTEDESKQIDLELKNLLKRYDIEYVEYDGNRENCILIANAINDIINERNKAK